MPSMSFKNLCVRPMTADDLEAVIELDQQSFSSPWTREHYLHELNNTKTSRLWVAATETAAQTVVGVIVCWLLVDEIHIATLSIKTEWRRSGIARELLCTALSSMQAEGAISATLDVRESNTAAQKLYEGFGFEVVARRPGYYQRENEAALLMSLPSLETGRLKQLCRCMN